METENKKPQNPPAFAFGIGTDNYDFQQQGMSLRDFFANSAMQALIKKIVLTQDQILYSNELHLAVPVLSYQIADEMLKEREKTDSE